MNTDEPRIFLPAKTNQPPMPGVPSAEAARHTPGTWTVKDKRGDAFVKALLICWGQGNMVIAKVSNLDACELRTREEVEANARLIAASPCLLQALQALLASRIYADAEGSYSIEEGGFDDDDHRAIVKKARAAIAKATQP